MELVDAHCQLASGAAITRPQASRAYRAVVLTPADRLLLENHAPSIVLEGMPAVDTEPRHTTKVARAAAELRGERLENLARTTTEAAREFFRLG